MIRSLTTAFLIIGAFAMNAVAQEKKVAEPKKEELREPYKEYVTVKQFVGQKDLDFLKPTENVLAFRDKTKDGKDVIFVSHIRSSANGGRLKAKSQITDKDGAAWELTEDSSRKGVGSPKGAAAFRCIVKKLPEPKKK